MAWSFNAVISNSSLPPAQRFVAIQISSHVNEQGDMTAFPSVGKLSRMTGYDRRTVQRAIAGLVDAGFIEVQPRHTEHGQTSNLYRLVAGDIMSNTGRQSDAPPAAEDRPPCGTVPPKLSNELSNRKYISRSSGKIVGSGEIAVPNDIAGFNRFWAVYPRKVGKPAAEKAWRKAIRSAPVETIMAGLSKYIAERQRDSRSKVEMLKFTAHPATWLNQERWNDSTGVIDDASF